MTDYTSTFTEGTGDTIDATDFSTEFDAIEAAVATKEDSANFIDEDDMSSDDATKYPSQQSVKAYVDTKTAALNTKIVNIGAWDITATGNTSVAHGVTFSKIRTVSVTIVEDSGTFYYDFLYAGLVAWNATNVTLTADASGTWDTANFNDAVIDRGWITIQYTD